MNGTRSTRWLVKILNKYRTHFQKKSVKMCLLATPSYEDLVKDLVPKLFFPQTRNDIKEQAQSKSSNSE